MHSFLQDARYAVRSMRQRPGYFAVILLTLALGIGATSAIFSVLDAVLLRPLPFPHLERLVTLGEATGSGEDFSVTWNNFENWRYENHTFEAMAAFYRGNYSLTGRGDPIVTHAAIVTSSFFRLIGARAMLGRVFDDSADKAGAAEVAVVSHSFWANKLGADPKAIGSTVDLDGKAVAVIGVLAPGHGLFFSRDTDLYLPLAPSAARQGDQHGSIRALALLKPGVPLRTAIADLTRIQERAAETGSADPNRGAETGHVAQGGFLEKDATQEIRPTMAFLFGGVLLVLLIACANVASLILARSTQRSGEMAVRLSIGAGRGRLIRQLLTENLLMAVLGGIAGVTAAFACLKLLVRHAPQNIPRLAEVRLDAHSLLFSLVVTLLTGLLVGLAPVFFSARIDLRGVLNSDSRTATGTRRSQSLRSLLVTGEIAAALMLAFAASLFFQSLWRAENASLSFDPEHVLAVELQLPGMRYATHEAVQSFYDRLEPDLRTLPGVTDVAATSSPPSGGDRGDWFYSVDDAPQPTRSDVPVALINVATPEYFHAMRIPLREGRAFTASDRHGAPDTAIVNQTFARKWLPQTSAVGHKIKLGGPYMDGPTQQIIGVAADVSQMGLDADPLPEIYQPFAQSPPNAMVLLLRTSGAPNTISTAVRRRVASVDPLLPIQHLGPFQESLLATLDRRLFITRLVGAFALLALALDLVGVYGLLSYWVSLHEEDLAIRVALGARREAILRLVGGRALRLIAAGGVLGTLGTVWASRLIAALLFDTAPGIASATLTAMILGACFIAAAVGPVWRASRIDVLKRLRRS